MNGTVNAFNYDTTVVFQYSTDGGNTFDNQVPVSQGNGTVTGSTATAVSAGLGNLTAGMTYYYRISATNVGGTTVTGASSFTTPSNPVVLTGTASFVGSQSAQLNGTVTAMGAATTVSFVYGTEDGSGNFTALGTVGATPGTVTGSAPVAVSVLISSTQSIPLTQGATYYYEIVATSAGLTTTSAPVAFNLSILSDTASRQFPDAPADAQGSLLVNLTPAGTGTFTPGWRLVGEQLWRAADTVLSGLVTGNYQVEYEPTAGYAQPPTETISVTSGAQTELDRQYYPTSGGLVGGLQIVLAPANLTGAQWRFLGQGNGQWKASGTTVNNLSAGNYLIECKPVTGQTTPSPSSITVVSGQTLSVTLTYLVSSTPVGAQPAALSFATITGTATPTLPYAFVGQIRSDVGSSTGFVVKPHVVATAAHVVFDDGSLSSGQLSYVTGLQWLFQREAGTYEPVPMVPQGALVYTGYSAQRIKEGTPGISTPASQNLDVAAMYFLDNAGGGGASGYLASDAFTNEYLIPPTAPPNPKVILVGYPVDGITAAQQGEMFATPAVNTTFTQDFDSTGNPYQVYTTTGLTSVGGNSGGPLCVLSNGTYYPAAIYLGGATQTDVRAIDSSVIALFDQAETNGETGTNNTGGGITVVNTTLSANTLSPASLQVILAPGAASGATWNLGETSHANGETLPSLSPNNYMLYVTPVSGYITPDPIPITLTGGQQSTVTVTYALAPAPSISVSGNFSFGSVTVGAGATSTLTIANPGTADLVVSSISYPSGYSGAYAGTIPAGGSQNVTVTFAPTAAISYGGTITVNSNASSGTSTIGVFGTGVAVPVADISVSGNLAFGNVNVGSTLTRTLTIANPGTAPLIVIGIIYPSGYSGDYAGTIAPGGSQDVTVTFAPTSATADNGNITVNCNAAGGVSTAVATGTGLSVATGTDAFGGSPLGGGFDFSPWFGTYNVTYYPWIYRTDLGFIYVDTVGTDFYLYIVNGTNGASMGWLYTNQSIWPNVYSFSRNSFLYFDGGTTFSNYSTGQFETY